MHDELFFTNYPAESLPGFFFENLTNFQTKLDKLSTFRYKSFEKAFSLAIDINDADLFMVLYKCTKAHGLTEISEESMKKADEIYAEEEESHRELNF